MDTLTHKIKSRARELGFSKVGIARAEELSAEGTKLREWLGRRYHGTMDWMAKNVDKRVDPRLILPNAQSVVCVAMNYYTDVHHVDDPTVGKISRYAWGEDYHIVVTERLRQLFAFITTEHPAVTGKLYVDTGPVMDKAWAVRAGIGWLGKHTNVITKEYGSWVFLGEIILDVPLEYDEPMADFCGSCTACIEACPTGAIVEPYLLDSTRCISYLTIEYRESFSSDAASHLEHWVYGCDICQDVCPWNRFQQPTQEAAFEPRAENIAPKLSELAEMTEAEFRERFRRSPVKRTKHEGLVRNAKAVLAAQNAVV
jgi:epoxyqueuosine reductase